MSSVREPLSGSSPRSRTMIEEVRAEMAASVLRVDIAANAPVAAGQTLLLLESMKMEIPVNAEMDGVVERIEVSVGDVVRRGDLLAILNAGGGPPAE